MKPAGFVYAGRVWAGTASVAEARAAFERRAALERRAVLKRKSIFQPVPQAPAPRAPLVPTRTLPAPSVDGELLVPEVLPADAPPRITLHSAPDSTEPLLRPYGHQYIAGTSALVGGLAGAAHAAFKGDSVLEGLIVGGVVGFLLGEGVRRLPGA